MSKVYLPRTCYMAAALSGSLLLILYMSWGGSGEDSSREHWDRFVQGDLEAFIRNRVSDEPPDLNDTMFGYKAFMERRKKKIAAIKSIKRRKGVIQEYMSSAVVARKSCVPFKTLKSDTRLCVHSKLFDPFISSHIRDTGSWEPDLLTAMVTALKKNPGMHLVDVGCNVGAFTFHAAVIGRRVVAIDPIRSNLFMLHSSLQYAGLRDNVTLLLNAVSDIAEPVKVLMNEENLGGSHVEPVKDVSDTDIVVDAITMDDLVHVVNFKKIFLKIDIEGYEWKALSRASNFFQNFDVRYLLIEWLFLRHSKHGQDVIDFLTNRGFRPYADALHKSPLNLQDYYLWPDNVLWYKKYKRSKVKSKLDRGDTILY